MVSDIITTLVAVSYLSFGGPLISPLEKPLATHEMSLEKRYYPVQKENILLNLAYLDGRVSKKQDINWNELQKPFEYQFSLEPRQTFAFHDDLLPEYQGKVARTTNAHFNAEEGFKSYGYLFGDGVCHLASLIYWVAKDAGLEAVAPANHNFMAIPEISREYGVSIYSNLFIKGSNAKQNLYITNNKDRAISFKFEYDGVNLKASVLEN